MKTVSDVVWRHVRRSRWVALGVLTAAMAQAQSSGKVVVYAAVGPELTQWDVDVKGAALTKRGSVTVPDSVQYAWPHPSHRFIYVGWSNGVGKDHHGVTAYRIDPASGALSQLGNSVPLPARPINLTTDIPGTHLLIAYNDPSGLTVHQLGTDGSVGPPTKLPASVDVGVYAHQVRVDPSNKTVIFVTRGNRPTANKKEDPGALKVFSYDDGALTSRASIAPGGGFGFQPRHLDFHTSGPWIYLSLEPQNKLQVYKFENGSLSAAPLFTKESLLEPQKAEETQVAGTVHVHPNGRVVYQANRTILAPGGAAPPKGENAIVVYAINEKTGEPTRIQNIDTRGITPRAFALDPGGRILVAGNQNKVTFSDGNTVPASLAVFRVRDDGKLDFVRKYDVEADAERTLWWMGVVALP